MRSKLSILILTLIFSATLCAETEQDPFTPATHQGKPIPAPDNSPSGINKTQIYEPDAPYAPTPPVFKSYVEHYLHNNSNYHNGEAFVVGGVSASTLSNNATVVMTSLQTNIYTTNSETDWNLLGGIGAGVVFPFSHHRFTISLDPTLYFVNFGKVEGIEQPFSTPPTLNYAFYASSMAVLLDHVLLWGAFFLTGILVGFILTFILMQASKLRY